MKSSSSLLLLTLLSLLAGVPASDPQASIKAPGHSNSTIEEAPSPSSETSDTISSYPILILKNSTNDAPTTPSSPVSPSHAPPTIAAPNTAKAKPTPATAKPTTTPTTVKPTTTAKPTTTTPIPATTVHCIFTRRNWRVALIVAGVLMVACVGLLVTTALLTWKLCQRRREAEPDSDLISNSEFWMGSAQRNKAKCTQRPPAKDSCLLLGLLETKEGQQGAGTGDGGEGGEGGEGGGADKEQEGKGGEGEVDAEANGTAVVLAPVGGPSESGPPTDPCPGGGSGDAV